MAKAGLAQRLMIDASHANAAKRAENQVAVVQDVSAQLSGGELRIVGVMVESHLVAGRQDLVVGRPLTYGQSITDPCLGFEDSVAALETLAAGARERRVETSRREGSNGER
jgi:3-deoxy-7-phosphoheptulonate synthase